ncbi:hypothetical protein [Streptomyces sp. SP18CS02]|uniref:hypothetical protein n=1 Tax=Streptomyces sp. SP18CS02 TaxID=3002531 RepID=UPI002E776982|nr:hypothetical protein [Streptomyces sp. SP18CS02]MEE1754522.1 hypothetical protein [Streptomyces sp. SP18CS02]
MRASRALAVAATACVAVGLTAPLAAATDGQDGSNTGPRNVTVSPSHVHQGGQLAVSASGCPNGGSVSSNAFPRTALTLNRSGQSAATPRIYDHATPGQYNLAVRCNNNDSRVVTRVFSVISGRGAQGGLGGSMAPSSTEMTVGAALVGTAAIGGGLFISRRRRLSGEKV